MAKRLLCLMAFFIVGFTSSAFAQYGRVQEYSYKDIEHTIYFENGIDNVNSRFARNDATIRRIISNIYELQNDTTVSITGIKLVGGASPEGGLENNIRLSEERVRHVADIIMNSARIDSKLINTEFLGEDYHGLKHLLRQSGRPYSWSAINIIDNYSSGNNHSLGKIDNGIKDALRGLDNGKSWNDMLKHFFPELRRVTIIISYKNNAIIQLIRDTLNVNRVDTLFRTEFRTDTVFVNPSKENKSRKFKFALKTNLLYDVALVPNIGLEIPAGQKWSVAADWSYAWWSKTKNSRFWRTYGGDIAVRRWLGDRNMKPQLAGHHVGLYGQLLTYDFEIGGKGYLGDKWTCAAGLEYGYSCVLTKSLHLDFSIGLGYMWGKYKKYDSVEYDDCDRPLFILDEEKDLKWIGPTSASASLVWILDWSKK